MAIARGRGQMRGRSRTRRVRGSTGSPAIDTYGQQPVSASKGLEPGLCSLALRKADGDETVQWLPRRSTTQNDLVLAAQSGLSGHLVLHPHRPLIGHQPAELRPLAPPVLAVNCLRPISDQQPRSSSKCSELWHVTHKVDGSLN